MKSFKNHYNRSKTLPILQNSSFENPLLLTNSYTYYNVLSQSQKDSLVWICGGNDTEKSAGPSLVNGINGWNILNPFSDGNQCIALQSTSFIQQSFFFKSGSYNISVSYISRSYNNNNQINILIDNVIIGTFGNFPVNVWTIFSQQFTISNNSVVVLKLIGLSIGDVTTAIDNITIT